MKRWWSCHVEEGDHCVSLMPIKGRCVCLWGQQLPQLMAKAASASSCHLGVAFDWVWGGGKGSFCGMSVNLETTACWAVPLLQKDQPHSRTAQWTGTTERQQRQQKVERGKSSKGRGKGAIPLVSKAAPYSISWPHKTLLVSTKKPLCCICMRSLQNPKLFTPYFVSRGDSKNHKSI